VPSKRRPILPTEKRGEGGRQRGMEGGRGGQHVNINNLTWLDICTGCELVLCVMDTLLSSARVV